MITKDKAITAFEWASDMAQSYPPAAYNRAALAGRRGDALQTVYWLLRLRFMYISYYNPGSNETEARVTKARTDTDFDPIRANPEYQAFERCLPPEASSEDLRGSAALDF